MEWARRLASGLAILPPYHRLLAGLYHRIFWRAIATHIGPSTTVLWTVTPQWTILFERYRLGLLRR